MAFGARAGSALRRAGVDLGEAAGRPPIVAPQDSRRSAGVNDAPVGASPCPELACVRHLLGADVLAAAQDRAAEVGVGGDRVLIAGGAIGEEDYLRALGESLGVGFEPLDRLPRQLCPVDNQWLIEAAAQGMLPISENDDMTLVLAPRGTAARYILRLIESNAALARRFRFTTAEHLNRFVLRYAGKALAARATARLQQKWPALSAAPPQRRSIMALAVLALALLAGALYAATAMAGYLVSGLIGFLGLARRRLWSTAWVLLLMPAHWLLLSLAAWRALYQLAVAPYAWEKTEHGLAKNSRLADDMTRALLELESYLRRLKETGKLPALAAEPKDISSARRRRPAAGA